MRPALISNCCLNNTYQSIKGLQLTELLWELLGVIQVDCPTLNMLVLCACRQLPRLALIKDLLKIQDALQSAKAIIFDQQEVNRLAYAWVSNMCLACEHLGSLNPSMFAVCYCLHWAPGEEVFSKI